MYCFGPNDNDNGNDDNDKYDDFDYNHGDDLATHL